MSSKVLTLCALVAGMSMGCAPESKKIAAAEANLDQVKATAQAEEAARAKVAAVQVAAAELQVQKTKEAAQAKDEAQARLAAVRIEAAGAQVDQAKQEFKAAEAAQDAKDAEELRLYVYARKAEYITRMKGEMASMHEELTRFGQAGVAQNDTERRLAAVRDKWARANEKLDAAGNATESNWEDMKAGFTEANRDLKSTFRDTRQWLSDAIKP